MSAEERPGCRAGQVRRGAPPARAEGRPDERPDERPEERPDSGHRAVPHNADLRVEAWAGTRERCIAEAVLGAVEAFAEVTAGPDRVRRCSVTAGTDEDLLVAVLEEVVFVLDTTGAVPVRVEVSPTADGAEVALGLAGPERVLQVGAAPKAVSLNQLRVEQVEGRWSCTVTLDV